AFNGFRLRGPVEQGALLEKALRDHFRQPLHHQVAGAWIALENPQERLAVDVEQPAWLERDDARDTARLIAEQGRPAENVARADDRALRDRAAVAAEDEPQAAGGNHIGAAGRIAPPIARFAFLHRKQRRRPPPPPRP